MKFRNKTVKKHLRYARYIARHKAFVGYQCFRQGLIWRSIVHDWHKMLPSEWVPYTNHFYGSWKLKSWMAKGKKNGKTGDPAFDAAHGKHIKRADHHTEWWVRKYNGYTLVLPMSPKARLEMMCDWWGVHKSLGKGGWESVYAWYKKNGHKLTMHDETREWVDNFMEEINVHE